MTTTLALLIVAFVKGCSAVGWFDVPSFSTEIVVFLALSNVFLYWFTMRKMGEKSEDFVKIYLSTTVLRILFFGAFIFAVIFLDRPGAPKNALFFLICYFLFTAMEVWAIFHELRSQKALKSGQKNP